MTREIPLADGRVALVDDADFDRLSQFAWSRNAGGNSADGYAYRVVSEAGIRREIYMHKEVVGAGRGQLVDHRNRRSLDNRRANLRPCSAAQNARNRGHSRNECGYRGVRKAGRKYDATLMVDGRVFRVGGLVTPVEAAVVYDRLAAKYHGEFALLNFSTDRDWILPEPRLSPRALRNVRATLGSWLSPLGDAGRRMREWAEAQMQDD